MFNLDVCHVDRTDDHQYLIRWHSAHPGQRVAVYMSDDPKPYYAGQHPGEPVAYSNGEEIIIPNPDEHVRHYFFLESECGEVVILAERKLFLEGAPNFRDLGGYQGADGRRLKWGHLYRSSKLSGLTDRDVKYFNSLGITVVCDFRQPMEQELYPTRPCVIQTPAVVNLPVDSGSTNNFMENLHKGIIAVDNAEAFMREMNRDLIKGPLTQYAEMFRLLLSSGNQQMLFHCASGKDRTGVGAALILDALGVAEEQIIEDYLLTNKYLGIEREIERLTQVLRDTRGAPVSEDVLRPLLELRPEYIAACFDEIRERYKSKQHFYETALNLDEEKLALLRERYLH